MEQEILDRLEALEQLMREHTHTGVDSTSQIEGGKPNIQTITSAATITPKVENDVVDVTALGTAVTFANPAGTPYNTRKLMIRIKDDGTARGITWESNYVAGGVALPSTTVLSKILTLLFVYNTANSLNKWQLIGSAQEA